MVLHIIGSHPHPEHGLWLKLKKRTNKSILGDQSKDGANERAHRLRPQCPEILRGTHPSAYRGYAHSKPSCTISRKCFSLTGVEGLNRICTNCHTMSLTPHCHSFSVHIFVNCNLFVRSAYSSLPYCPLIPRNPYCHSYCIPRHEFVHDCIHKTLV